MQERIKIKHDGPRGWAGIVPSAFDPAKHERYEGTAPGDDLDRAKARGIKGAHLMKPETLAKKIAAAEKGE